jgi:hypothetical protein
LTVCSTSDDGCFRVSSLEARGQDGALKASLRSKRHFSPSDIALSSCALLELEGPPGLAILGSWDNSIYLYSISRYVHIGASTAVFLLGAMALTYSHLLFVWMHAVRVRS